MFKRFKGLVTFLMIVSCITGFTACSTFFSTFCSLQEEDLRTLANSLLPDWDEEVLNGTDGENWSADLTFTKLFTAMGDTPAPKSGMPSQTVKVEDRDRIAYLVPKEGKVNYINRTRRWNYSPKGTEKPVRLQKAIGEQRALDAAQVCLQALNFPLDELNESRLATQMGAGAPVTSDKIVDQFEMYRLVTFNRKKGEFPVYGSRVRIAFNNKAQIQRAQIQWPQFKLKQHLKMIDREKILNQIVSAIVSQTPKSDLELSIKLGYSEFKTDDTTNEFIPALLVSVHSPPTPYQFIVPIAH